MGMGMVEVVYGANGVCPTNDCALQVTISRDKLYDVLEEYEIGQLRHFFAGER